MKKSIFIFLLSTIMLIIFINPDHVSANESTDNDSNIVMDEYGNTYDLNEIFDDLENDRNSVMDEYGNTYDVNDIIDEIDSDNIEILDGSEDQSATFITPPTSTPNQGVSPFTTFYGEGGSSSLNWGASGHIINWRVRPSTIVPYVFGGTLKVTRNGSSYKSFSLSGYGGAGLAVSDTIDLWKLPKGTYKFTLSGVAAAMTPRVDIYKVSKGASITIKVN